MLGLLTTYAPLLVKLGISLIDLFVKNSDDKVKAKKEFIAAIQYQATKEDELLKVSNSVDRQINNLNNMRK